MQDGTTPLQLASQSGHKEVIELLINNGADVDEADRVTYQLLMCGECMVTCMQNALHTILGSGSDVFTCLQKGITSLHLASFNGHKEVVGLLLDRGASVDKADKV